MTIFAFLVLFLDFIAGTATFITITNLRERHRFSTEGITTVAKLTLKYDPSWTDAFGKQRKRYTASFEFVDQSGKVTLMTRDISSKRHERLKESSSVQVTYIPGNSETDTAARLADEVSNNRDFYISLLVACLGILCVLGLSLALLSLWQDLHLCDTTLGPCSG
jgi:hypothetical protein